jgi:hypothetical protein
MEFEFTKHSRYALNERQLLEEWVWQTLESPDWMEYGNDNNIHYFKSIVEREGRILHVVVNQNVSPSKIVTIFFDRKARRKK